jgi:hypothetical protein
MRDISSLADKEVQEWLLSMEMHVYNTQASIFRD